MTVKRGTSGSGITEKLTLSFDEEADKADPEIAAALERATLEGWIASAERECFAIMADEGLPTYHGCYLYEANGSWRSPRPPMTGSMANEIWPIARARGHAPDSEVGFAARMLGDIVWLRRAREKGDHERAALFAGYLMAKEVERRIKREREAMWQRGVTDVEARARGGRETAKVPHAVKIEAWRAFYAQTGKAVESDRLAAEKLGLGESTIRAARTKWQKDADASD